MNWTPGHFECILFELGEADPIMLKRAAAIDRVAEQLMVESAQVAESRLGLVNLPQVREPRRQLGHVALIATPKELEAEL